ncbi:MAG: hypothetical protein ACYDH5_05745 [Acidimicrobiales bacterium]
MSIDVPLPADHVNPASASATITERHGSDLEISHLDYPTSVWHAVDRQMAFSLAASAQHGITGGGPIQEVSLGWARRS